MNERINIRRGKILTPGNAEDHPDLDHQQERKLHYDSPSEVHVGKGGKNKTNKFQFLLGLLFCNDGIITAKLSFGHTKKR